MDLTLIVQIALILISAVVLTFLAVIDVSPSEPKNHARTLLLACEHIIYAQRKDVHKMLVYHANAFSFELHQENYNLRADAEQLYLTKDEAIIDVFRSPEGFKAWLVGQQP
ncbi:hypothetical protein ACP3V3_16790 [Vibrio sp. PNB22_3_1]